VHSDATTADAYVAGLPDDRRAAIGRVRQLILEHLPAGFEEVMQNGMISYVVPLERYPNTYNGQALGVAALANQKRYMSIYLTTVYADDPSREWFRERWAAAGKRLDMGKSCLRFKRLDDLALDVLAETIARASVEEFLAAYERSRARP
jgi:hypothetical protein